MSKKALLIVLDGYGEGKNYKYNAVTQANTPYIDSLRKTYPSTLLRTEGQFVGLPKNSMGGSEVGHYTMGAGRIVYQSLEEIDKSIKSKEFFKKKELINAIKNCQQKGSKLHLLGMISDKGVHSHLNHLNALLKFAKQSNLKDVYIHAITDGRDCQERSAQKYIKQIQKFIKKNKTGKFATIIGRYYAMDRDKNLDRTKQAYDLYTKLKGKIENDPIKAINNQYKKGIETDYYIEPIVIDKKSKIEKNDSVIFFNYRTDRAMQLTKAFTSKKSAPYFLAFGPYTKNAAVLFPAKKIKNNLGEILSKKEKKQLRIAESEKYAHVTFFFNSQNKQAYKYEDRIMVDSPKVSSYNKKPEMSANKLTKKFLEILATNKNYDFIALNFANGDLVGHSGEFEATVKSIETLDKCLKKIIPQALKNDYSIILTADHGNAEFMKYKNGENCPSHTLNPVICILITNEKHKLVKSKKLGLDGIAPTILELMKIKQPKEMTGKSLLKK